MTASPAPTAVLVRADPVGAAWAVWRRRCLAAGWTPTIGTERIPVQRAVGRVTAGPVHARCSVPAFELAAMDGIAVRAGDLTGASSASPVRLTSDAFDVIDTGDPVPQGRDAVVMREHVTYLPDGGVEVAESTHPGRHVRAVGENVLAGEPLLPGGHRLRPVDVAVTAGAGHDTLVVRRRPRVAILPTGDEVRPIGTPIRRGEVLDTNSPMLASMAEQAGCEPVVLAITPDDRDSLATAVRSVADWVDLVLVIAGSSAGRDDHTADVLAELGEVAVHGVAMRPGHPVVLGVVGGRTPVPVIGVPGYPVAAAHVFDTFARPLIGSLEGTTPAAPATIRAHLAGAVSSPVGVDQSLLVRLKHPPAGGAPTAVPIGRGASALSALMRADGVLRLPAGCTGLDTGSEVLVERRAGAPTESRPDEVGEAAVLEATGGVGREQSRDPVSPSAEWRQARRVARCVDSGGGA